MLSVRWVVRRCAAMWQRCYCYEGVRPLHGPLRRHEPQGGLLGARLRERRVPSVPSHFYRPCLVIPSCRAWRRRAARREICVSFAAPSHASVVRGAPGRCVVSPRPCLCGGARQEQRQSSVAASAQYNSVPPFYRVSRVPSTQPALCNSRGSRSHPPPPVTHTHTATPTPHHHHHTTAAHTTPHPPPPAPCHHHHYTTAATPPTTPWRRCELGRRARALCDHVRHLHTSARRERARGSRPLLSRRDQEDAFTRRGRDAPTPSYL